MTEHWSNAVNGLPSAPCNEGCPRSTASGLEKALGRMARTVMAQQSGCAWHSVCGEVAQIDAQQVALDAEGLDTGGLGNYKGDADAIQARGDAIQALRDGLIAHYRTYPTA